MKPGSKEFHEAMDQFERDLKRQTSIPLRFEREDRVLWPKGIVYQDGRTNDAFTAYRWGYAFAEASHRNCCG